MLTRIENLEASLEQPKISRRAVGERFFLETIFLLETVAFALRLTSIPLHEALAKKHQWLYA